MNTKFKNSIFLTLTILFALGSIMCNNEEAIDYSTAPYKKVEIYCWCFYHDPVDEAKSGDYPNGYCSTIAAVAPSDLISKRNFFDSVSDISRIRALQRIIFKNEATLQAINQSYTDSRFLILFKRSGVDADTVVYSYPNELYVNNRFVFKYSFNVIDSVRQILGKERIVCKDM